MCQACSFTDDVTEDVFHDINEQLNGWLAIDGMVQSVQCIKGQPIQREAEDCLVGFQVECSIMQEYLAINCLIMASVYSFVEDFPPRSPVIVLPSAMVYGKAVEPKTENK